LPIILIDHFANRNAAAKTRFKMVEGDRSRR
jgi:hypothetical protein